MSWLHQQLQIKTDAKPAGQPADFLNVCESELFCHSEMQHAATSDVHPCGCAAALQIVCFLRFAHVWLSDIGKEEKRLTRLSLGAMLSSGGTEWEACGVQTKNRLFSSLAAHFVSDLHQNVATTINRTTKGLNRSKAHLETEFSRFKGFYLRACTSATQSSGKKWVRTGWARPYLWSQTTRRHQRTRWRWRPPCGPPGRFPWQRSWRALLQRAAAPRRAAAPVWGSTRCADGRWRISVDARCPRLWSGEERHLVRDVTHSVAHNVACSSFSVTPESAETVREETEWKIWVFYYLLSERRQIRRLI